MYRALLCVCLTAVSFVAMAADGVSFERAQKAVEQGEFKAITSILVAQDGKVVYEHYFDAQGAEGRRNTRSVTKTVTGMLAGLAIADGRIPSASARVFDLPSRAVLCVHITVAHWPCIRGEAARRT